MNEDKQRRTEREKMKKIRKKEKKCDRQKRKIGAKARTAIRNSIDAKAFQ